MTRDEVKTILERVRDTISWKAAVAIVHAEGAAEHLIDVVESNFPAMHAAASRALELYHAEMPHLMPLSGRDIEQPFKLIGKKGTTVDFTAILAELDAAHVVLRTQIRGLRSMGGFGHLSPGLAESISEKEAALMQRRKLIIFAEGAISDLRSDGYPAVTKVPLSPAVYAEMLADVDNIRSAATDLFEPGSAMMIAADLAGATIETQPAPTIAGP